MLQLCLTFGGMFADRAFLQYGWLKEDVSPPHLFGVDRHDFEYDAPFSNNMFTGSYPEPFTAGGLVQREQQCKVHDVVSDHPRQQLAHVLMYGCTWQTCKCYHLYGSGNDHMLLLAWCCSFADSAEAYQQEASRLRTVLYFLKTADQAAGE